MSGVGQQMTVSANSREDKYTASRRGEGTSKLPGHEFYDAGKEDFSGELGGLADSANQLQQMTENAQEAQIKALREQAQKDGKLPVHAAVNSRGEVKLAPGSDPLASNFMANKQSVDELEDSESVDTDLEKLRKARIAQMKEYAAKKAGWLQAGHGKYTQLFSETSFLQEIKKHERAVVHLHAADNLDAQIIHHHLQKIAEVHLETSFLHLDVANAEFMMQHLVVKELPVIFLCLAGKVVGQLDGIDRSFTTEGLAYELSNRYIIDFDETAHYNLGNLDRLPTRPAQVMPQHRLSDSDDDFSVDDD